jgi:hypothetical protein
MSRILTLITALALTAAASTASSRHLHTITGETANNPATVAAEAVEQVADSLSRYMTLTDDDYREVAQELGVEVAAIKAVVDIEAGRTHQGFGEPGKPLINFDLSLFRRSAQKHGVNLAKYRQSHAVVFASPNARRYGTHQNAQHARLEAARRICNDAAIESTFWGMFQIGGFNWPKCGTADINEFVEMMSRSERDQLELFARFITNSGMLPALKAKNWSAFAARYNGPSYRSRGYHTRMAAAYAKHLKD